jgi:hypothetical protein
VLSQRHVVVGIVVAGTTLIAGCGFESPAVTTSEHNSIQATDFAVGAVRVADTSITTLDASGTAGTYLIVTLVNNGSTSDKLIGITSAAGAVTLTGQGVVGNSVTLPPGLPVSIDQPLLAPQGPTATITTTSTPKLGTYIPVRFAFAKAGTSATEQIPIVPPVETTALSSPVPNETPSVPTIVGQSASD